MTRSTNMEHVEVLRLMRDELPLATDEGLALDAAIASLSAQQPAAVDGAGSRDAEIEALRAELRGAWSAVDSKAGWEWKKRAEQAEARAKRLAEALREARDSGGYVRDVARAALRDHDQEVGNG